MKPLKVLRHVEQIGERNIKRQSCLSMFEFLLRMCEGYTIDPIMLIWWANPVEFRCSTSEIWLKFVNRTPVRLIHKVRSPSVITYIMECLMSCQNASLLSDLFEAVLLIQLVTFLGFILNMLYTAHWEYNLHSPITFIFNVCLILKFQRTWFEVRCKYKFLLKSETSPKQLLHFNLMFKTLVNVIAKCIIVLLCTKLRHADWGQIPVEPSLRRWSRKS